MFVRISHRLFDGAYRRASKTTLGSAKSSSKLLTSAQLYQYLVQAMQLLVDWQLARTDGGIPRLPSDLGGTDGTYGQLCTELRHLELVLDQSELEELGPNQLADRLRVFIADRVVLYKLPELYRLTVDLEGVGLADLLAELAAET